MLGFRSALWAILAFILVAPVAASAHEVYVIAPERVAELEQLPPVPFLSILAKYFNETIWWGALIGGLIVIVFLISISARLESYFDDFLIKLKHYAPFIARVTAGLAFLFCAYNAALFGPELPFSATYGSFTPLIQAIFYVMGVLLLIGFYARIVALVGLVFYAIALWQYGIYLLTYTNYLGELLVLLLVGSHRLSVEPRPAFMRGLTKFLDYLSRHYGEYAFLLLRVGFGFALIYASAWAKILHNQLALEVVNTYDLVRVFGMPPEFIVFGAAIVEIALGIFFILGIEIRFTAVVLNIFLTLSLFYFGEAVWPHIILIGVPIAFFCYGYDKYSLEGYFFKKGNREPIF